MGVLWDLGNQELAIVAFMVSFLENIQKAPQCHASRLILADWLEEQNDHSLVQRGQVIRLQSRLADWVPQAEIRLSLQQEEQRILAREGTVWHGLLAPFAEQTTWSRGLAQVTLPGRRFIGRRFAEEAFVQFDHLGVETLRVDQLSAALPQINTARVLGKVIRLDLSRNILTDDELGEFLRSPHLARLHQLDLSNNRLTDWAAGILAKPPTADSLRSLQWLDLRNNKLSEAAIRAILNSPLGRRLVNLEIQGNPIPNSGQLIREVHQQLETPVEIWCGMKRRTLNSLGIEFSLMPAGSFFMGSPESELQSEGHERPVHLVTLNHPVYLGVYTITQEQYQRVMGDNPSHFHSGYHGGSALPVETVSWDQANQFCQRISELPEEKRLGHRYRLPTEAEWEYAARAGITGQPFHFGYRLSSLMANFNGQNPYNGAPRGPYLERTVPVGSYSGNPWGFHDMNGNVWEWCLDWYAEDAYQAEPVVDPTGPPFGERRVLRGGSWLNQGVNCRVGCRDRFSPDFRYKDNGFRVVLETS